MIGRIRGVVIDRNEAEVMLDTAGGVAYQLQVSRATLASLPAAGQETVLWVTTRIRDEMIQLYGFAEKREQAMFLRLLKVNGVGPKLAFQIISGGDIGRLEQQLMDQDSEALCRLPGVGKKLSRRLVLELGESLKKELGESSLSRDGELPAVGDEALIGELQAALEALGYRSREVTGPVEKVVAASPGGGVETLLKLVLQEIHRG
jgi:Holliday junction DNA helicase RuvA